MKPLTTVNNQISKRTCATKGGNQQTKVLPMHENETQTNIC